MKKLFTTSALVSALAVSGAYAAGPGVSVGGFIDFQAGFSDQDLDAGQRDFKFANDTEVHVKVGGTADNGLKYGAVIELEADISVDADAEGLNADKTYIFLESEAGRLELGGNVGAEETLKVDASSIARATGGIDGDFYDFVNTGAFLDTPDLPAQFGAGAKGTLEDATKITYYTPRFSGFQFGVSYTPDIGNTGTAAGFTTDADLGQSENNFHLGLNYSGDFDGVGVDAGITGTFGDAETNANEDLEAYNIGLALSGGGFSLAGSYGDWQESLQATGSGTEADYWTLGAAYETGPFGVSVTYLQSELGTSDFDNIVVGADYALAPGLTPYIEASFFDADAAGTAGDNEGSVVLVGTQLNF